MAGGIWNPWIETTVRLMRNNCVQNQITIANRVLIRNKVAGFIIVGGQDNIQMRRTRRRAR